MKFRLGEFFRGVLLQYLDATFHGDMCLCWPCLATKPEKSYYTDEGGEQ